MCNVFHLLLAGEDRPPQQTAGGASWGVYEDFDQWHISARLPLQGGSQNLFQKAKENQVLWPQLHNVPLSPVQPIPVQPKQALPFPAPT